MKVKALFQPIRKSTLGFRQITLTLVLSTSLLAILLILVAFYSRFSNAIKQITLENSEQLSQKLGDDAESYFSDMQSIADSISKVMNENTNQLDSAIQVATSLRSDIEAIVVFDRFGNPISPGQNHVLKPSTNIYAQDWFNKTNILQRGYDFSMPHVQNLFVGKYEWVVSFISNIQWKHPTGGMQTGTVLVDINFSVFKELAQKSNLSDDGYIFIIDRYGNIVYHPHQQLINLDLKKENTAKFVATNDGVGINKMNGNLYAFFIRTIPSSGWRIIGINPMRNIMNFDADMKRDISIIIVCIILFALIAAAVSSYYMARPVRDLKDTVNKVQKSNFTTRIKPIRYHIPREIKEVWIAFQGMVDRIQELLEQIKSEQELLRKSELRSLQAQINPHFLYNTLDSIVWLSEVGDFKGVSTVTVSLANLLRASMKNDKQLITVLEEIQYAKSYLTIQKIRYKDKFDSKLDISPEIEKCKVMKILLQPLIENAIYHGIDPLIDKATIKISAFKQENLLIITVEDDGCGMNEETLSSILTPSSKKRSGIGVYNVHQRIQLLFGNEYGLEFESQLEEGTKVTIRLPLQIKE